MSIPSLDGRVSRVNLLPLRKINGFSTTFSVTEYICNNHSDSILNTTAAYISTTEFFFSFFLNIKTKHQS